MDIWRMASAMNLDNESMSSLGLGRQLTLPGASGVVREGAVRDLFCGACVSQGGWAEAGVWLRGRSAGDLAAPIETIVSDKGLMDFLGIVLEHAYTRAAVRDALP